MEVTLTMPEDVVITQGDEAHVFLMNPKKESKKDAAERARDIKMYIIARGKCEVIQTISDGFEARPDDERERKVCTLIESDHFGEIGLIYDRRRTCSVVSLNYCTLATISRPDFLEIKRDSHFDQIENQFKQHICLYEDEIKLFAEYELNKVDYFRHLSPPTKNDVIFSMEKITFTPGSLICERGETVDKMILI